MSRRETGPLDSKIYVGGLPEQASRSELEAVFSRYGRLRNVWVARRPPGFAFIEFEDPRDAADAARALDGTRICGVRARVEVSHGRPRHNGPPMGNRYSSSWEDRHGGSGGGGGGGGYGSKYYDRSPRGARGGGSRSRSPAPRRYGRSRSPSVPRGGGGGGGRYYSRSRSRD